MHSEFHSAHTREGVNASRTEQSRRKPYCVPFARGARDCEELWQGWRALTKNAPPFLQPEFYHHTRTILDSPGELFLAVGVVGGLMTGVLPLALQGRDLRPLQSQHSPRFDFVGDSCALAAIWEAMHADRRWDRLMLGQIPAQSRLATELPMVARRFGCLTKATPSAGVPYFALPGFEGRMDSKFRANVRRCARKAGDLVFERHAHPTRTMFAEALAIEAMAWKGSAGT
ncbi:MAG TPA: hypothetical protein VIV60_13020, partial [Polyangiaceae bacterium]